jgi:hypothetical protein
MQSCRTLSRNALVRARLLKKAVRFTCAPAFKTGEIND